MMGFLGGLGGGELLVIGALVFLLFGAKKLPELARGMGRSLTEFKKGMSGVSEEEPLAGPKKELNGKTQGQA